MAISAQDAINSITSNMTVSELRALANTVEASVGDSTLLLYSGGVGAYNAETGRYEYSAGNIAGTLADGTNIKTISNTQINVFFNDYRFVAGLQAM